MNKTLPRADMLKAAMAAADVDEIERVADEIGREAVAVAIAAQVVEASVHDDEERQRMLDAALADAIEAVARHRGRLGRRVCNKADGKAVRLIFETLRGMQSETSDLGFPS